MKQSIYAVCPKCCGRETVSPVTSRVLHDHEGMSWDCAMVQTLAQAQDCQKRWRLMTTERADLRALESARARGLT